MWVQWCFGGLMLVSCFIFVLDDDVMGFVGVSDMDFIDSGMGSQLCFCLGVVGDDVECIYGNYWCQGLGQQIVQIIIYWIEFQQVDLIFNKQFVQYIQWCN